LLFDLIPKVPKNNGDEIFDRKLPAKNARPREEAAGEK
jgi:hypothetical protein